MGDTEYIKLKVVGNFKLIFARLLPSELSSAIALCRSRQQRDSLPCEADNADGEIKEVLQREGRGPRHLPPLPLRRPEDQ